MGQALRIAAVLLLLPVSVPGQTVSVWYLPMLDSLGSIADTATVEHVACLLGGVQNDTLYVMVPYKPKVAYADTRMARFELCPPIITVALWHNHVREYALPVTAQCDLSEPDRRLTETFQVVHVTRTVSCAWVRWGSEYQRLVHWPPRARP